MDFRKKINKKHIIFLYTDYRCFGRPVVDDNLV